MIRGIRMTAALVAAVAVGGLSGANALAANDPPGFGLHVAMCAKEHLGKRADPPAVICTHDGMTMTFPTFGAMVQHMREHHG